MRFVALCLLLLVTGCKTYCRQLSEKVCDCTTSTTEKTSCLTSQASKESIYGGENLTQEQEDLCEGLLQDCDCRLIDTPAGRQRCGMAY